MAAKFDYEITEHIAIIGSNAGYTLELNRVSYNGYPAKLDLRRWRDGQPLKGVTLSNDEARSLLETLQALERAGGLGNGE